MQEDDQFKPHADTGKGQSAGKKVLKIVLYLIAASFGLLMFLAILGSIVGSDTVATYLAGMVFASPIGLAAWFFRRKLNAFQRTAAVVTMAFIVWLGVSTQDQTEKARSLGFLSSDEMEQAAEAGFADKISYEKHLADLAAAEKAKVDAAAVAAANQDKAEAAADAAEEKRIAEDERRQLAAMLNDAKALNQKYDLIAGSRCGSGADDYLRSIARHDFAWDDDAKGFLGRKFPDYLVKVDQPGVLTMVSDYAKLQNGFGAYTHIKLFCRYDTQSEKVLGYSFLQ